MALSRVCWLKKYNKRGGWSCGLARLVSTFRADNKACLCLDEPLGVLLFHNPRPHRLCLADPVCQRIKLWAGRMDWAFQRYFTEWARASGTCQSAKSRVTHRKGVSFHGRSKRSNNQAKDLFHLYLVHLLQHRWRFGEGRRSTCTNRCLEVHT